MARISFYKSVRTNKEAKGVELFTALESIKNGEFKSLIAKIRLITNKEEKTEAKQTRLPAYTFAGRFKEVRSKNHLTKSSGLAVLDFDDVDNLEELIEKVNSDKYTFSSFVSPSGNGVKVLVKIPPVR